MISKNKVNLAIQVLPQSNTKHPYAIVDKAIEVIQQSGLNYQVCPFETVVEGSWDEVMALVQKVHEACYQNETDKMMMYLKIQSSKDEDLSIEDKMHQYH
ncbi:MAG: MTH1187 family thiamine-binding protein [Prolixibacteraceae bacterium]|nr:MTH1187 family thiamine-binding protein [Prolixibacteraceae bacterium]